MGKRFSFSINLVLVIIIILLLGSTFASGNNPGSASDPVVTASYVEKRISELSASVDDRLANVSNETQDSKLSFQVIQVSQGQIISLEENSLFILRAGTATAIAGTGGGLSNLTTGFDIQTGGTIDLNHLLLTPKSDGRGVLMTYDGWIMISGGYSIQ